MKLEISPFCPQCQWQDTPTPSADKKFDWNIDPKQGNPSLTTELKQQISLLESELQAVKENEEHLLNLIDYLQNEWEKKENHYIKTEEFQHERLNNCCQTELKLEELLTRYKKGKASWEKQANLLEIELQKSQEQLNHERNAKREAEREKQLAESNLQAEKNRVAELETELNENDEILAKKNREISRLINDLATAYNTINQLNNQAGNLESEIAEKEEDLTTAEEILATKNQKIAQNQVILNQEQADLLREKQDHQRTQSERDNYLAELHELEQDFSEQERLLAEKNAKLATAIAEKNDLQKQLTNERSLNQNLQNQINNHNCPALVPHTCPNEVNCSHADYQEIKEQRDNYQRQAQTACQEKEEKERQVIQQINQDCHLGLNNPSLEEIISRIQELIEKPPVYFTSDNGNLQEELNQANQTISRLEKELKEQTPFGEDLAVIKEIDLRGLVKGLNIQLSAETVKQIQQATSYQQLATARNAEIKKHLGQNLSSLAMVNPPRQEIIQPPAKERIIWLSLLLTALLTIGGLLAK
ncbi:MAG: hypothetical protein MRECE_43c003 [Mycoplasmataceae bacterium CE_OT135]|nr:MAG: hypothetical protein MRECE_43c003 [Mycoplasmataceae bacterium CE_OT135]